MSFATFAPLWESFFFFKETPGNVSCHTISRAPLMWWLPVVSGWAPGDIWQHQETLLVVTTVQGHPFTWVLGVSCCDPFFAFWSNHESQAHLGHLTPAGEPAIPHDWK